MAELYLIMPLVVE